MTAIVWFRRDLRLGDNLALTEALRRHDEIVPLFVREPDLTAGPRSGLRRNARLERALVALDADLRSRGGRLVVADGPAPDAIARVAAETGATEAYAQRDYTPFGVRREAAVAEIVPLRLERGLLAAEPEAIGDRRVFAAFHRRWTALPVEAPLPAPDRIVVPAGIPSGPIALVEPRGEAAALARADEFAADRAAAYPEERDRLDVLATSHLSADLHFGAISVRQLLARVAEPSFRRQLAWRDWAHHVLWWRPEVARQGWSQSRRRVDWRDDEAAFAAWRDGRTGFPTVDAGMRQLAVEGWIANRARLIVASFLTKELLIDWRRGERHFLAELEDGDVANNALNWQWVAGVGPDAAPYFRILDPVRQGERFDPRGTWVRRWIPELARVPDAFVHRPWDAPDPPASYPLPIVDRRLARERALAAFRAARDRGADG